MSDLKIQGVVEVSTEGAENALNRVGATAEQMAGKTAQAADKAGKAVGGIGNGAAKSADEFSRAEGKMVASIKRAQTNLELLGKTASQKLEFRIDERGLDKAKFAPMLAGLREVEAQAAKSAAVANGALHSMHVSAKQTEWALRGVPAQFTDIVTSLQGGQAPLTVFLQQGGQLKDMFGGAGNAAKALGGYVAGLVSPVTVAAAAFGAYGYAMYQAQSQADEFTKTLIMTGNAAGSTAAELQSMAQGIATATGTFSGPAVEALDKIAGSGKVAKENFELVTLAAVQMQRETGQSIDDTIKQFDALAKDPVKALLELNSKYNFLTESIYKSVKAAQDEGDAARATSEAQKVWAKTVIERTSAVEESLGRLDKGWRSVAALAASAWNAMQGGSAVDNIQRAIKEQEAFIRSLKDGDSFAVGDVGKAQAYLEKLIEQRNKLTGATAEQGRETAKVAAADDAWSKMVGDNLSKQQKQRKELADLASAYTANISSGNKTEAEQLRIAREYEGAISQINEKYKESTKERDKAANAAKREADSLAGLMDRIYGKESGLSATYWDELEQLNKQFKKTGDLDTYTDAVATLTKQQKFYQDQVKAVAKAEEEAQKASADRFSEMAKISDSLQDQVAKMRIENEEIGLTAEQLDILRLARIDEAIATKAQALAVAEKTSQSASEIEMLREQIYAMRELRGLAATGQSQRANARAIDDQKKAWSSFFGDINRGMTDSIFRSFEAGEDRSEVFFGSLKRMAATTTLKFGIEFAMDAGKQALGLSLNAIFGGTAGSGGGLGSALGLVSNASSAYGLLSGQTLTNAANVIGTGYGALTGTGALGGQAFSAGLASPTASEAAMWAYQSAFQTTGEAAYLATAEGIAAGQGAASGFLSSLGTAALVAAPLIIGGLIDKFGGGDTFQTGVTLDGKYSKDGFSGAIGENYKTTSGWFHNGRTETYLTDLDLSVRDMIGMLTSNAERQVSNIGGEDYYTYKNTLSDAQYAELLGQIGMQVGEKAGKVERVTTEWESDGWADNSGFVTKARMVDAIVPAFKTAAEMTEAEIRANWSNLVDVNNYRYLSRETGNEYLPGYDLPMVIESNTDGDFMAYMEQQQKLNGFFGGNVRNRSERLLSKDLGTYDAISTALDGIYDETVKSFEKLGKDLGATDINAIIEGYTADITIDNVGGIKDLLTGAATQLQEGIGRAIFPVIDSIRATTGETGTWSETFARVSAQTAQVAQSFEMLDVSLSGTGLANDILSTGNALQIAFGGLEGLQTTLSSYYENYYSAEEKRANVVKSITEALSAAGADISESDVANATREQFRAAYESIVATSGAASPLAVAMLRVEGAFAGITDAAGATAQASNEVARALDAAAARQSNWAKNAFDAAQSATDAAFSALERSVNAQRNAIQSQADVANEAINNLQSIFSAVDAGIQGLLSGSSSVNLGKQGMAWIEQAARNAKTTGYLPDVGDLQRAIQNAQGGLGAENFSSAFEQERARLRLAADLDSLRGSADPQMTVAEQALAAANAQLTALDATLASAQEQLDAARGIDTSVKTVEQAIKDLQAAVVAELKLQTTAFVDAIFGNLKSGNISPVDAVSQLKNTGTPVASDALSQIKTSTGTETIWASSGGAVAVQNPTNPGGSLIYGNDGLQVSISDAVAAVRWVESQVATGAISGVDGIKMAYAEAKKRGISSASLDALMGWPAGTSLNGALAVGLPAFSQGANVIPRDMIAQIHKDEAIIPARFNPWAGGTGFGGDFAELARQLAALQAEVRQLREDSRAHALGAALQRKDGQQLLERWDKKGLPPEREALV